MTSGLSLILQLLGINFLGLFVKDHLNDHSPVLELVALRLLAALQHLRCQPLLSLQTHHPLKLIIFDISEKYYS